MARFLANPAVDPEAPVFATSTPTRAALDFHTRLPGYAPTPLHELSSLASELDLSALWLKDESNRFGLPAFKFLGASWATLRILERALGEELRELDLDGLRARLAALRPATLVAATDGNHGRAVARMAALLDFGARIFVPEGTDAVRSEAIAREGAEVTEIGASYERTLEHATVAASEPGSFFVQDVSWPGFEEIPAWVVEGYATLFWEVDERRAARGLDAPELVVVPIGGGTLASAVIAHFRRPGAPPVRILGVEPVSAACALAALEQGGVVEIECRHSSTMAGLNCGRLATTAWPLVRQGLDGVVAIEDELCGQALRLLAREDVVVGECGAAGLAGLLALRAVPNADEARRTLGLDASPRVLLLGTEGPTNPESYRRWTT